jgi:hypothetical protein
MGSSPERGRRGKEKGKEERGRSWRAQPAAPLPVECSRVLFGRCCWLAGCEKNITCGRKERKEKREKRKEKKGKGKKNRKIAKLENFREEK